MSTLTRLEALTPLQKVHCSWMMDTTTMGDSSLMEELARVMGALSVGQKTADTSDANVQNVVAACAAASKPLSILVRYSSSHLGSNPITGTSAQDTEITALESNLERIKAHCDGDSVTIHSVNIDNEAWSVDPATSGWDDAITAFNNRLADTIDDVLGTSVKIALYGLRDWTRSAISNGWKRTPYTTGYESRRFYGGGPYYMIGNMGEVKERLRRGTAEGQRVREYVPWLGFGYGGKPHLSGSGNTTNAEFGSTERFNWNYPLANDWYLGYMLNHNSAAASPLRNTWGDLVPYVMLYPWLFDPRGSWQFDHFEAYCQGAQLSNPGFRTLTVTVSAGTITISGSGYDTPHDFTSVSNNTALLFSDGTKLTYSTGAFILDVEGNGFCVSTSGGGLVDKLDVGESATGTIYLKADEPWRWVCADGKGVGLASY